MSENFYGLIIRYFPEKNSAVFKLTNGKDVVHPLDDAEPLKEYENKPGLFTLEGQRSLIFSLLQSAFEGEDNVSLSIEVEKNWHERRSEEFKRLEEAVTLANKLGPLHIHLSITDVADSKEILESTGSNQSSSTQLPCKVAVMGKMASGKTELIKGVSMYLGSTIGDAVSFDNYSLYRDDNNRIDWYEVNGIDLGKENFLRAKETVDFLIADGVTHVVYCFHAMNSKIEDIERDYIVELRERNPELDVLLVITHSVEPETSLAFAELLNRITLGADVIETMAKRLKTKGGYVLPFGMDAIAEKLGIEHERASSFISKVDYIAVFWSRDPFFGNIEFVLQNVRP